MKLVAMVGLMSLAAVLSSCSGPCGLQLKEQFFFPKEREAPIGIVQCCGASAYKDLNLLADDAQIDVINSSGAAGRVDAFVTDGNCTKLFAGSYAGIATSPLCKIYVGPVAAGVTAPRTSIRSGQYRVFAQAYSTNDAPAQFLMEVGLWSEACRWTPVDP